MPPAGLGSSGRTVIVELTGVEPGSLPRIERLPGVVSVTGATATGQPELRMVTVAVTERDCDGLLRELLRWDGVHVRAVRP